MALDTTTAPTLSRLLEAQLEASPGQSKSLRRRFEGADQAEISRIEDLAVHIAALIEGSESRHAQDYDWICQTMIEEELHFRREGRYRLSTFAEAIAKVYSNKEYMTHYMNGLLMTQLWWSNHSDVMHYYRTTFLPSLAEGSSLLEIGPGHGLYLYFAAAENKLGSVTGWDVSEASITMTAAALGRLGLTELPRLERQDLFDSPEGSFDAIVFSEVLEHMEDPARTLAVLRTLLAPSGRMFLNMPINSPAPDHLFNMDTPEALQRFVEDAGFKVLDTALCPATNQSLEAARRKKLTISCAFVVERA
jgi:2-polyprenyl-3-methyl-5-hydroxy-6-metoxy-1,4-benzoquinol methylase